MKKVITSVFLVSIFLLTSCGIRYIKTFHYNRPAKERFKFKSLATHNNGLIDTGS